MVVVGGMETDPGWKPGGGRMSDKSSWFLTDAASSSDGIRGHVNNSWLSGCDVCAESIRVLTTEGVGLCHSATNLVF